jgi:hypothetical protein
VLDNTYPVFVGSTTSPQGGLISSTNLNYNANVGTLYIKTGISNNPLFDKTHIFSSSINSLLVGPVTVNTGVTLTVATGGRLVIV